MKKRIRHLLQRLGYDFHKYYPEPVLPPDYYPWQKRIYEKAKSETLTGPTRSLALINAVKAVLDAQIPGALVECGVWRGGSAMIMAETAIEVGFQDREIWLYDTFEGMSEPTGFDVDYLGFSAAEQMKQNPRNSDEINIWCYANETDVSANMEKTGYPRDRLHLIAGKVEETLLQAAPEEIALLRLDTDFYESTKMELEILYPRLAVGGVLILDDYGHWAGARKAVDEYFRTLGGNAWFHHIDFSCRLLVKQ